MNIAPDLRLPDQVLDNHIAVLGKTGSGKTSTAKLLIEGIVRERDARVCILDPIKSDWWGLTLDADGRSPGLPFSILGGPRAHVPLHADAGEAIGRVVAAGGLRHSIIDMANFGPGDHARFFIAFAEALFRNMKGVVYLVVEEAHKFAPKERAGIGEETKSIHWMSNLATAARVKGVKLVVCTQRTQKLHNDVLGSCETLIVHRLTMPADQKPVIDWLKANTDAATTAKIARSLSSLKTGEGWICSGEAQIVRRVMFPRIRTFDNTSTPTDADEAQDVRVPPVDLERLRSIIGEAMAVAEDSDVKALRAKVKRLTEERDAALRTPVQVSDEEVARLRARVRELETHLSEIHRAIGVARDEAARSVGSAFGLVTRRVKDILVPGFLRREAEASIRLDKGDVGTVCVPQPEPVMAPPESLTGPQRRIIDAIAWWNAAGVASPSRSQVAHIAGYSPAGGGFKNVLSECRTAGLITDVGHGDLVLTSRGKEFADHPDRGGGLKDLHARILDRLTGPQRRVIEPLIRNGGAPMDRRALASMAGYEASGGAFKNVLSEVRTLGLVVDVDRQTVTASRVLFPEGMR